MTAYVGFKGHFAIWKQLDNDARHQKFHHFFPSLILIVDHA